MGWFQITEEKVIMSMMIMQVADIARFRETTHRQIPNTSLNRGWLMLSAYNESQSRMVHIQVDHLVSFSSFLDGCSIVSNSGILTLMTSFSLSHVDFLGPNYYVLGFLAVPC